MAFCNWLDCSVSASRGTERCARVRNCQLAIDQADRFHTLARCRHLNYIECSRPTTIDELEDLLV